MIAFAQILKDTEEFDMIARCWYSVLPYVDAAYITINGKTDKVTPEARELKKKLETLALARKYPSVSIDYVKWEKDFSKARNHNFSQVDKKYDYILWLDADDILRGGNNLREVEKLASEKNIGAMFFNYLYRVEIEGNKETGQFIIKHILIEHLRERLVKNDGRYKWISPIHETLIPQRDSLQSDSGLCDVVHLTTDDRGKEAIMRNVEILELQLESQGQRKDPRTLYYLAKSYFDLRDKEHWDMAEKLIFMYLLGSKLNTPSGWGEERAQAWEYLAEIYRERGEFNKGIKCILNALSEDPKFPNFYVDMALLNAHKQDWSKARHWIQLAQKVPLPKTTLVINPKDQRVRTLEVLFNSAVNLNDLKGAWAAATELHSLIPTNDMAVKRKEAMDGLVKQNEAMTNVVGLARYLKDLGEVDKLVNLVNAIPRGVEGDPIMISLRRDYTPPKKWAEDEIAIVCGKGFEEWSPRNLEKGIGGSEEAVIYLSQELTKLGWKVTVFGDPSDAKGVYDGVTYVPYYFFNPGDVFNILVGWRNPGFFDTEWKSKKNYLWLHDIQNSQEYIKERVNKITKIFPLSKWHRDNMPNVSEEKFMITGNGINLEHFEELDRKNITRDSHKCIYTSSYDRGLEHLLKIWPKVVEEVPDATLDIFYGWNLFDSFYSNNPERMAWKDKMNKMMEYKGITHHGRVGQKEVLEATYKAGVWAYPTHFGEISCITAMKCQAAGAVPVVCDYAALKETAQFGKKVKNDTGEEIYDPEKQEEYTKVLIEALKDTKWQDEVRPEMMKWARGKFSWGNIAQQWNDEFKRDAILDATREVLGAHPNLAKYLPYEVQEKEGLDVTY